MLTVFLTRSLLSQPTVIPQTRDFAYYFFASHSCRNLWFPCLGPRPYASTPSSRKTNKQKNPNPNTKGSSLPKLTSKIQPLPSITEPCTINAKKTIKMGGNRDGVHLSEQRLDATVVTALFIFNSARLLIFSNLSKPVYIIKESISS